MRKGWSLVVVLGLAVAAPASAIVRRDDRAASLYVALAEEPRFAAVGLLGGFCSGTLIAPDWVLTAAHCVTGGLNPTYFRLGGVDYPVASLLPHPDWAGTARLDKGHDIALVHLATAVTGVRPAGLYAGRDELGRAGVHVGFGNTGVGSTGYTGGFGVRRAGENIADVFGGALALVNTPGGPALPFSDDYLVADFDTPSGAGSRLSAWGSPNTPLDLEGSIAPGDSGGAFFLEEGGFWKVAGVHSWIDGISPGGDGSDNASYTDVMGSTRVSDYFRWIHTTAGIVAPEPGSLGFFGIALVVQARRFPRHRRRSP